MSKNNRRSRLMGRMTHIALAMLYGTLFYLLLGCQPAPTATVPASPVPPTPEIQPTSTPLPLPTERTLPTLTPPLLPTPIPTYTPTPDPVWSILFTGSPCSATASDCSSSPDSLPSENYFIYSDGAGLQLLSEMDIPYNWEDAAAMADNVEAIQLSPDFRRLAYMEDDNQGHFRFWIGDVGGDSFAEVLGNADGFWPYSFYGEDPNCLASFDDELENGEVVVTLYKSCIGDTKPTLIDMAVLPIDHTRLKYSLSPKGDKWLVYNLGLNGGDAPAALYVKEVMGDSNLAQQIFQEEFASCTPSVHWQDNETIEFLFANCLNNGLATYFYVIDWKGQELNVRYTLPALEIPPSESYASTRYYGPATGDWYADDNFFIFSSNGSVPPRFDGLYVLNLTTGEIQQILSNYSVSAVRSWLPATTSMEE